MSDATLRMDDVVRTFNPGKQNAVDVLRGCHLELRQGEMAALIAPSGSGKSTLLHLAGLLDAPDGGDIEVCGTNMTHASDAHRTQMRRENIGFVYQSHHLLPEFSAEENIILPQIANGMDVKTAKMRSDSLLECVRLGNRTKHRPAELSGGEQQRVAICRALANGPRLLLADEPTGNLDQFNSEQVFNMLLGICRGSGLSALIATHNMALAAKMDRIIELKHGLTSETFREAIPEQAA